MNHFWVAMANISSLLYRETVMDVLWFYILCIFSSHLSGSFSDFHGNSSLGALC